MSISRLLAPSLLIVVCASLAVAQSSSEKNADSAQPQIPLRASSSGGDAQADLPALVDWSFSRGGLESPETPSSVRRTDQTPYFPFPQPHVRVRPLVSQQDGATCYSIRSYRVVRDDPQSDSTRAAGYSTCLPATRFRIENAVLSVETMSR
jgi:hypothetical protein